MSRAVEPRKETRTNYNIDVEHWLIKLIEGGGTDTEAILRHFEIDSGRVLADLTRALDAKKTGNADSPALSPNVVQAVREAWLVASVEYGVSQARSSHILCALLGDESLARLVINAAPALESISLEQLRTQLHNITANSSETDVVASTTAGATPGQPAAAAGTGSLDQFTIDITARAP